jgi:hypothetical protein
VGETKHLRSKYAYIPKLGDCCRKGTSIACYCKNS